MEHAGKDVMIYLVGNKLDKAEEFRQVSKDEA